MLIRRLEGTNGEGFNGWAFYQLREFLTYKALGLSGYPWFWLILLTLARPAMFAVREESVTGNISSALPVTGLVNADFNGACNIAFLGLHVDQPEGSERPSLKVVNPGLLKALSL